MLGEFHNPSLSGHEHRLTLNRHYVAFIRKALEDGGASWVLFNDEKVVEAYDVEEMRKFAYVYFFKRA